MPLLSGRKGRVAMGEDMSRVLIETMVRKGIREIQEDPERSARNLVDMAIHFSPEGRFSRALFDNVQRMLRDEDSAYYALVSDMVHHMDAERLLTFGMLLGYDGFTLGAQRIRETEAAEGFDIPWSLGLELDAAAFGARTADYDRVIAQGRALGICAYLLFAQDGARCALTLAAAHPDCAFVVFLPPAAVTDALLSALRPLSNVMLSVRLEQGAEAACAALRAAERIYSVYLPYDAGNAGTILSGEAARAAVALHPVFTILLPDGGCDGQTQRDVYAYVLAERERQRVQTVLWELYSDGLFIDGIISEEPCAAGFDRAGNLVTGFPRRLAQTDALAQGELKDVLRRAFRRKKG